MAHEGAVPGGEPQDESIETTTVGLPRFEPISERSQNAEDRAAINALPVGSALLVAHEGPHQGSRFLLDRDEVVAGRHPKADIFLDDVTVSRQHAKFQRVEDGFVLYDTGSLNGTYVNQDRVDSVKLRSGMEVQIGKFRLTYYEGIQPVQ